MLQSKVFSWKTRLKSVFQEVYSWKTTSNKGQIKVNYQLPIRLTGMLSSIKETLHLEEKNVYIV